MSALRQPSLFAPPPPAPTRTPLLPPHATVEDMGRKREVSALVTCAAKTPGSFTRATATPVEALETFLAYIGRDAADLDPKIGADPRDVELRLTQRAAGESQPLHLLAILEGVTLDEVRRALSAIADGARR